MNLPLISILIPAYNAAPFLRRSVGSALAQTYANIEVVIVDDGSTDDTPAIADQLAADDRRIRVVHQENRGLAEARRSGIKAATADYICHLDADDELLPDALAFLQGKMAEHQLDIVYGSLIKVIGEKSFEVAHPIEGVLTGDEYLRFLFDQRCMVAQGEYICRRDAWSDDIFPPHDRTLPSEDVLINICLSAHLDRVGLFNKPVMKYYYVPTSLSSTNRLSSMDNWEKYFVLLEKNLRERGKLESLEREVLCMKLDRLAFYVYPLDTSRPWVKATLQDHRFKLPRRYALLQWLLHYPRLCHWCIVNNRRLKKVLSF